MKHPRLFIITVLLFTSLAVSATSAEPSALERPPIPGNANYPTENKTPRRREMVAAVKSRKYHLLWDLLHPSDSADEEAWAQSIEPTQAKLMAYWGSVEKADERGISFHRHCEIS